MRSMLRYGVGSAFCGVLIVGVGIVALAGLVGLEAGCINPKSDYTDWQGRIAKVEQELPEASVSESGVVEGGLDTAFTQNYVMACGNQLQQGDITVATRYLVTIQFTPSTGGGSVGTVVLTDQALVLGATSTTGSNLVGAAGTAHCDVNADGTCAAT
ncbi:MAG: hypothetical protein ACRELB_23540, partial [Polyangiaceae bacterium]